jgi:acetyl esterase/lipase
MRRIKLSFFVLGLAQLVAIQSPALAEQTAVPTIEEQRDLRYIEGAEYADGRDRLDLFMPVGATATPVVLFLHGGGLLIGDKQQGGALAKALVPRGIGVVASNYRLSPDVAHPAHAQDAAAAFAWTVRNIATYGGDPKRIYLAGHSAGAYLATLLSFDDSYLAKVGQSPSAIRGTIAISPCLDVEEVAPSRPKSVWGSDVAIWRTASPSRYLGPGKPPLLFVYADGDDQWRRDQIEQAAAALEAAGQETVETIEIADRNHLSIIERLVETNDPASARIADFILKPKQAGND